MPQGVFEPLASKGDFMLRKLVSLEQISEGQELYHYTKCSGIQGILAGRAFRATRSDFLNDTNEMNYILSVVRDVIQEIENPDWKKALFEQAVDTVREIRRRYYITAFSTEADSITLWAEFGEQTGYNAGFDSRELLERIERARPISYHGYVVYASEAQRRILRELLFRGIPDALGMSFREIMERRMKNESDAVFLKLCGSFRKALSVYALFFKQEEFSAEKEYRLAFREQEDTEILFREKDGFLLPYIWVDVTGGKKKFPIRSITVAPKNHVDLARKGMMLYVEKMGYQVDVQLSRIKLRY